ncbi:MAG: type II secretion system protein [Desulfobulbaceae bacterium]|nr:type II secretion system protein [Desulfobulbaceae bacterium]
MIITCTRLPAGIGSKGMTLVEVMLAMLMLAAVVTMVSLSISGSIRAIDATAEQGEVYHRAQVALQRISEDLTSALLVEGIDFNGNSRDNDGSRGNILEFTSTAHVNFANDLAGIAMISYILKPDPEDGETFVLLRRDNLLRPSDTAETFRGEETDAFLLCDGLKSVRFTYRNEAGDEQETWVSLSEDPANPEDRKLPVSVNITLEFWLSSEEDISLTFTTGVLLPVGLLNTEFSNNDTT